jgi:methylphosphotriester-DNA--protein-cysteine methyltransferase
LLGWQTRRVEQLAALATMSRSSFHRHFRAVTSMTPIQFQKEIRLREARARLIAEPGDTPSPFSRKYRRANGPRRLCGQAAASWARR